MPADVNPIAVGILVPLGLLAGLLLWAMARPTVTSVIRRLRRNH